MRSALALALLVFFALGCNFGNKNNSNNTNNTNNSNNSNNANNANKEVSMKDRFLGTWEVSADSEFGGGPITFKSDSTYSAQKSKASDSTALTGAYEIKGDRLYCKGELEDETKDGFKMDGERISLKMDSKTVYFDKKK